jgi:hypothetical protein
MKEIKLTQGKVAMVDDEDFEFLNQWKWNAHKCHNWKGDNYYSERGIHQRGRKPEIIIISMHRLIMGVERNDKRKVDHINHNTLDNRKENLRVCTNQQNSWNHKPTSEGNMKKEEIPRYNLFEEKPRVKKKPDDYDKKGFPIDRTWFLTPEDPNAPEIPEPEE